jgi:hypothetical protein
MLLWHVQGQLKIWKLIDLLPGIWADVLVTLAGNSHKEMKHRVSYSTCVVSNDVSYQFGKFRISLQELCKCKIIIITVIVVVIVVVVVTTTITVTITTASATAVTTVINKSNNGSYNNETHLFLKKCF